MTIKKCNKVLQTFTIAKVYIYIYDSLKFTFTVTDFYLKAYGLLLNQARASLWPACVWFLEITLMRTLVCVCVCVRPPGYEKLFT